MSAQASTTTVARILIVEDEAIVAMDLERRVMALGYEVVGIADRRDEAVELFTEQRPDLVLMDIRLRDGDNGIVVASELRRIADRPVVYITAHSDPQTIRSAASTAPYGYLVKPFEDRTLAVALAVALERRAADQRLRMFRAAVDASTAGVLLVSQRPEGCAVEHVNEAFLAFTGLARNQVEGATPRIPTAEPGSDAAIELATALETSREHRCELECVRVDGKRFIASIVVSPVPSQGEIGPPATLVWLLDVTRQRATEQALSQKHRLEIVGRLAAAIAHDFNNVLTAVDGSVELALEAPDLETAREDLANISQATAIARRLTRSLLESVGVIPLNAGGAAKIAKVIGDIRPTLGRLAGSAVTLRVSTDPDLVVAMNQSSLEQVLLNLVTNARDAMPEGGTITLDAARAEDTPGAPLARLTVRDTGYGMDETTAARIFEPFFTTKPLGVGTGIGLTTTRALIEQARGRISVRSALGEGTEFVIELPLVVDPKERSPQESGETASAEPPPPVPRAGMKVLIVDDDAAVLRALTRALVRGGFEVVAAHSFAEANHELRQHRLDLVVTDVNLGDGNGLDLIPQVRSLQTCTPLLVISGALDPRVARQTIDPRQALFLPKPFEFSAFMHTVHSALALKNQMLQ